MRIVLARKIVARRKRMATRLRLLAEELDELVDAAFIDGQGVGARGATIAIQTLIDSIEEDLEEQFDALDDDACAHLEAGYDGATPSPVVAAHFGASAGALASVRTGIRVIASSEEEE